MRLFPSIRVFPIENQPSFHLTSINSYISQVEMDSVEESIETRMRALEQQCSGPKIDFTACGLDDLDALTIALKLYQSASPLLDLYLGSNGIGDEGMAVANSLGAHVGIRGLYLGEMRSKRQALRPFVTSCQGW